MAVNERLDADKLRPGARVADVKTAWPSLSCFTTRGTDGERRGNDREAPNVSYGDVAGLEEEIALVKEAVELPLRNPALFTKVGVTPHKAFSVGPPGCGKTLFQAVANSTEATFRAWWAANLLEVHR